MNKWLSVRMMVYIASAIVMGCTMLLIMLSMSRLIDGVFEIFHARERRYYNFLDETKDCQLQEKILGASKLPKRLVYYCGDVIMVWEK